MKKNNLLSKRKYEHIELCLNSDVNFKKTNGFEKYDFINVALTTVDFNKIDLSTTFLNKKIEYPFLISSMTGGIEEAYNINKNLALLASSLNIPMGLGSQRPILQSSKHLDSYLIIRETAPDIPIISNLGISEVINLYIKRKLNTINKLIDIVNADAIYVHLNPVQELFQKEGNKNFSLSVESLNELMQKINVPVFVKEVGNGIDYESAKQLLELGIKGIDVSGSGGTNWQLIEMQRAGIINDAFLEWGLPTSYCIRRVNELKRDYDFYLIGSGGIKISMDVAKALALGADLVGAANIVLKSILKTGLEETQQMISNWFDDVKRVMFLTNSINLKELRNNKLIRKEELF